MLRRHLVVLASLLAAAVPAAAQQPAAYPQGPVRFIVPFPPGGSADALSRMLAERLQTMWGQPVVVESKPGGGTVIGVDAVAKSAPNGLTFGLVIPSFVINPSINAQMPYDTMKDLAGVTQISSLPIGLYANTGLPAKTVAELVAYGKANPKTLTYGSAGSGSTSHLAGQLMNQLAGLDMVHVPYKGSAPAQTDLIGGRLSIIFDSFASQLAMVKAGRINLLAVAGPKRLAGYPDVPTIGETVKGFDVESYFGVVVPKATPRPVVEALQQALAKAGSDPAITTWMSSQGLIPVYSKPAEFDAFLEADMKKWAAVVKSLGGKVE